MTDPTVHLNCELNSNVAETANDQDLVASSRASYFEILPTEEGILLALVVNYRVFFRFMTGGGTEEKRVG
jgi:hypothetical protein